ncbi:MAG: hypothetical protein ACRD0D_02630, partial [Acidimicrobiales bacterium]
VAAQQAGIRPDQAQIRPVVDAMRPGFDSAAAADPAVGPARDQLAWLQDYAQMPADAAGRVSASSVAFAVSSVTRACLQAG